MNFFLGGFGGNPAIQLSGNGGWPLYYPWYYKTSEIGDLNIAPGASMTFVFVDERSDSINWGNYVTDMSGYPAGSRTKPAPAQYQFSEDMPANWHDGSGAVSFADGHAKIHRWHDQVTLQPLLPNGQLLASPRTGVPGQGLVMEVATGE